MPLKVIMVACIKKGLYLCSKKSFSFASSMKLGKCAQCWLWCIISAAWCYCASIDLILPAVGKGRDLCLAPKPIRSHWEAVSALTLRYNCAPSWACNDLLSLCFWCVEKNTPGFPHSYVIMVYTQPWMWLLNQGGVLTYVYTLTFECAGLGLRATHCLKINI